MKRHIFLLLMIGLISCSNGKKESTQKETTKRDTSLITTYKSLLANASEFDKKFVNHLLKTIEEFENRELDTTLIGLGQFEEDNKIDTIKTRVFEENGKIIAYSSWTKNGKLLWEKQIIEPYMWINENPLFEGGKRSKWVTFTIGVYHTSPNIYRIEKYENLRTGSIRGGIEDLKKNGFEVDTVLYKKYIENYKGDLMDWGQPESRDGLFIWYEPLKRFVSYYKD